MSNDQHVSRRDLLRAANAIGIAAPLFNPSRTWAADTPPSDRLTMEFIGMGTQNRGLLNRFLGKTTQVVAVCDVDTTRREAAKQTVEAAYAKKAVAGYKGCTAYVDFRELLARKDIDAVCIASPDHSHAIHVVMAAKAKNGRFPRCRHVQGHGQTQSPRRRRYSARPSARSCEAAKVADGPYAR